MVRCLGSTLGRLVAHHVRPGAAEAGRAHRLVRVDHNVVLRRTVDHIIIVVDDALAVVMLANGQDVPDITGLDRIVAILVHKAEGLGNPALVIGCG